MMVLSRSLPRSSPDHWAHGRHRTGNCARRRVCATVSQAREAMKAYHPHQKETPAPRQLGSSFRRPAGSWRFAGRRSFTRVFTLRYKPPHIYTSSKYGTRSAVLAVISKQHVYWIDAAVGAVATGAPETPGVSRNATQVRDLTDRRSLRHQHRWPWRVCDPRWCAP
jgi:hypothetical protein